jgi:uncharacterized protein YjaZ
MFKYFNFQLSEHSNIIRTFELFEQLFSAPLTESNIRPTFRTKHERSPLLRKSPQTESLFTKKSQGQIAYEAIRKSIN